MKQCFISRPLVCLSFIFTASVAQIPLPVYINHIYNNETKTEHYPVIISPSDESTPAEVKNQSNVEFIGRDEVHLKPGFTTSNLATSAANFYFNARIAPLTDDDFDAVIISPDPATNTDANGILHVNKWEKYEVAFKLPQVYEDACTNFLDHYYLQSIGQFNQSLDMDHWVNPYASDSIEVRVDFTKPDGTHVIKWAFYMKEANWAGSNYEWDWGVGTSNSFPVTYNNTTDIKLMSDVLDASDPLNAIKDYHWHIRFAPDEIEPDIPWTYTVTVITPYLKVGNTFVGPSVTFPAAPGLLKFICDPPLPNNHGFVRVNTNNNRYLKFDDGTPYFGIGFNYGDAWRVNFPVADGKNLVNNPYSWHWNFLYFKHDFDITMDVMDKASDVGINFMLFPMQKNNFGAEWQHLGYYDKYKSVYTCSEDHPNPQDPNDPNNNQPCKNSHCYGEFDYNYQNGCKLLDQVIEQARRKNIYLELTHTYTMPLGYAQSWGWDDNAYWRTFVKNADFDYDRQIPDPQDPTGTNFFWIGGGGSNTLNFESFYSSKTINGINSIYYWKRLYKYIMARWGYSVNVMSIMPFDEVDQTLGYYKNGNYRLGHNLAEANPDLGLGLCNNVMFGNYYPNPYLKTAIENWIGEVIGYIKEPVSISGGVNTGGLGENRLFSMSFTAAGILWENNDNWKIGNQTFAQYYEPLGLGELDLMNIHIYGDSCNTAHGRWNVINLKVPTISGQAPGPLNLNKPVCNGEVGAMGDYILCDNGLQTPAGLLSTKDFYNNYEISLHNEMWSSAFQGGYMIGGSWFKQEIFKMPFSAARREFECPQLPGYSTPQYYPVASPTTPVNMATHTLHHQYKILSDFINVPYNGLTSNLIDFNDNLVPYKYYGPDLSAPNTNNIESYYLLNSSQEKAWGWVHNLDHYWANKYIETHFVDNNNPHTTSQWDDDLQVGIEHDDCNGINSTTISLEGFLTNTEYAVIFYQTYADASTHTGTWLGETLATTDGNGKLPVTVAFGCDSTDGDYGMYIVKNTIAHREMHAENEEETLFDFTIRPTASRDLFYITVPNATTGNFKVTVNDLLGNVIYQNFATAGPFPSINLSDKSPGTYFVTCHNASGSKTKRIIKL